MPLYINKVWLSGKVHTQPRIRKISEKTKATSFILATMESWESRNGDAREHRNEILVEVLGRDAQAVYDNLSPGDWVNVDGYMRSDQFKGRTAMSVRVYKITYEGRAIEDKRDTTKDAPGELRISTRDCTP